MSQRAQLKSHAPPHLKESLTHSLTHSLSSIFHLPVEYNIHMHTPNLCFSRAAGESRSLTHSLTHSLPFRSPTIQLHVHANICVSVGSRERESVCVSLRVAHSLPLWSSHSLPPSIHSFHLLIVRRYTPTFVSQWAQERVGDEVQLGMAFACLGGADNCRYTLNYQKVTLKLAPQ
jgi:hypothetical protein